MGSTGSHAILPAQQALSKGLGVDMAFALDEQVSHDEGLIGVVRN